MQMLGLEVRVVEVKSRYFADEMPAIHSQTELSVATWVPATNVQPSTSPGGGRIDVPLIDVVDGVVFSRRQHQEHRSKDGWREFRHLVVCVGNVTKYRNNDVAGTSVASGVIEFN
jgi:hypothetical protein